MNRPRIIALVLNAVDSGKSGIVKPPVADLVIPTIPLDHKFNATIHKKVGKCCGGATQSCSFHTAATNGKTHISPWATERANHDLRLPVDCGAGGTLLLHRNTPELSFWSSHICSDAFFAFLLIIFFGISNEFSPSQCTSHSYVVHIILRYFPILANSHPYMQV